MANLSTDAQPSIDSQRLEVWTLGSPSSLFSLRRDEFKLYFQIA